MSLPLSISSPSPLQPCNFFPLICRLHPFSFEIPFQFPPSWEAGRGGEEVGNAMCVHWGNFFFAVGRFAFSPHWILRVSEACFLKRICTLFPGLEYFRFDYLAKYGKCVYENFNFTILPWRWTHCHRRPPPPFGRWAGPYSEKRQYSRFSITF